jgi:hypothetical protein
MRHVYELMYDVECTEDNRAELQKVTNNLEQELHLLQEEERGDKNRYAKLLVVHFGAPPLPAIKTGDTWLKSPSCG